MVLFNLLLVLATIEFLLLLQYKYKAYNNVYVYPFRFITGLNDAHTQSAVYLCN